MYTNKYKFSFLHRFLHWTIAIGIFIILSTVFLRLTWMNKNTVGEIIYASLQTKNINLSQEDAVAIAKQIRKPMFNWHIYTGYVVSILYLIRIIYMIVKRKQSNHINLNQTIKQKLQAYIYILFYILLGITLVSGLLIENGPKDYKKIFEQIHAPSLYFMIIFLVFHFAGIFIGEKTTEKGIVSAMINGGSNTSDNDQE